MLLVAVFPLAVGKLRVKFEAKLEEIKLPPTIVKVTDLVILFDLYFKVFFFFFFS